VGLFYASLATFAQTDIKRIIAYSSVGHMNYALLGLFCQNAEGLQGAMYLMVSHGIISAGLFACAGFVYERFKTRTISYFAGLNRSHPRLATLFFLFAIANMGFPGTAGFFAEVLVLLGIMRESPVIASLAAVYLVVFGPYSLWLYTRIFNGPQEIEFANNSTDLDIMELFIGFSLLNLNFVLGLDPDGNICLFRTPSLFSLMITYK
jgi:NADH-quinone oxidoreductase subunit M